MGTATKTGLDAAKTASKRVVQKTAEAKGDLSEIKQLIKLLHQAKQIVKKKEKKKRDRESKYHQKKDSKLLMT